MLSDRKGEKKEQYLEGVTFVSLVMCSRRNGWRRKLLCFGCAGVGGITAPLAADMYQYRKEIGALHTADG
jgi:hypothetical protein